MGLLEGPLAMQLSLLALGTKSMDHSLPLRIQSGSRHGIVRALGFIHAAFFTSEVGHARKYAFAAC